VSAGPTAYEFESEPRDRTIRRSSTSFYNLELHRLNEYESAVELGLFGIRVNTINPSITRPPMTQARITKGQDGKETHPLAANIPLGRLAEPEEIAQVAA
jgi:enoyl-ACP reductase-like protein